MPLRRARDAADAAAPMFYASSLISPDTRRAAAARCRARCYAVYAMAPRR